MGVITQPYDLNELVEEHTNGQYTSLLDKMNACGDDYDTYFDTKDRNAWWPHMCAGLGLKVGMNENFVLSADWGMPINKAPYNKQDNQKWANFYVKMGYLF